MASIISISVVHAHPPAGSCHASASAQGRRHQVTNTNLYLCSLVTTITGLPYHRRSSTVNRHRQHYHNQHHQHQGMLCCIYVRAYSIHLWAYIELFIVHPMAIYSATSRRTMLTIETISSLLRLDVDKITTDHHHRLYGMYHACRLSRIIQSSVISPVTSFKGLANTATIDIIQWWQKVKGNGWL